MITPLVDTQNIIFVAVTTGHPLCDLDRTFDFLKLKHCSGSAMTPKQGRSRHAKLIQDVSHRWTEFQRQAKRRELCIAITEEHHTLMTSQPFWYCGILHSRPNGIDRFNNVNAGHCHLNLLELELNENLNKTTTKQ